MGSWDRRYLSNDNLNPKGRESEDGTMHFSPATQLDSLLRAARIPIVGVCGPPFRVSFGHDATGQQKQQAKDIIDKFEKRNESGKDSQ